METLRTTRLAFAACALFMGALATEARADLNIASSVRVQCLTMGAGGCDVLRFTLEIPPSQVLTLDDVNSPAVAGTYNNFRVGGFTLENIGGGSWSFGSLMGASPGNWTGALNPDGVFIAGEAVEGGWPAAPIFFDVSVTGVTSLADLQIMYGATGTGTGPTITGQVANSHTFSTNGLVTPIPEPATMLLLGSGLMGLAGVGRRRRRNGADSVG